MSKKSSALARGAIRGLAFAAATLLATAAWAVAPAPAQVPLVSRVASPPPPNVMITIDDSGSMQANFMPEGNAKVNGTDVPMPVLASMADMVDIWYGDQQTRTYSGFRIPKGVSYADPDGTNLFQRQMRSSSVNSIFYNPAVLYLPWLKPDGVTRMDPARYTGAYWDPLVTTGALATTDLSKKTSVKTYWCGDAVPANCSALESTTTYDPALYYVLKDAADPKTLGNYTQFDLNDGKTTSFVASDARVCTAAADSPCCAAAGVNGCTLDQERQNFANWFVYYRTRALLMKGAMSEALSGVVGPAGDAKLRVGWGTINSPSTSVDGEDTTVIKTGVRDLDANQLKTVLTGIQSINAYGGTPLRQATATVGAYYRRDADKSSSPWRTVPGSGDSKPPLACRRSYELLTTDGYYNDADPTVGNVDGVSGPTYGEAGVVSPNDNPLGLSPAGYIAAHPYSDTQSNRLADVAMAQYVEDLQPKLPNQVPQSVTNGDLAYWQHMNTMTVGLGVTGKLDPVADLPGLTNGTTSWTDDKIDDLWHAALDTHGQFFSAKDSVSLTQGLTTALGSAAAQSRSEGGAATSGATLSTNTFKYLPGYSPVVWTGFLKAFALDPGTGAASTTATWDAAKVMPAAATRKIYTWDGAQPVVFDTSMSSTLKNLVAPKATQDSLIGYIRGDQSNEGPGKLYRQRSGILGDFIDSAPLLIKDLVDLHYDKVAGGAGYRDYVKNKAARPGILVEGANDGMLHAFRAVDGVEVYGYVPKVVLPNLATYASQSYGSSTNFHRDYVDGPQIETDAFIKTRRTATAWADLVVGSYGAGAPGFYALDMTDQTVFDDKTLMWEVAGGTGGDADVGYVMSKIAVGVLPATGSVGTLGNGKWKAFVGNGVYSANGNAVLLIVDLETGTIERKVQLTSGGGNGLMGVKLLLNDNQEAVAAYAGDLQGNLWRVDLTGASAPTVGFNNKPLFRAFDGSGRPQPIVEAPAVYPRSLGSLVLFGTGKLIDAPDADSSLPQTFYGVWDNTPAGTVSTAASLFAANILSGTVRQQLTEQTITALTGGFYAVSSNDVDFTTKYGWFMDLSVVNAKQRVIYSPLVIDQFVLINTMSPGATPAPQSCDQSQGTSAYFLLPAETGSAYTASPVWDVDGNGTVGNEGDVMTGPDGKPIQAAGYSIDSSGGDTNIITVGSGTYRNVTSNTGTDPSSSGDRNFKAPCIGGCFIQKRVWQQLMTPPF